MSQFGPDADDAPERTMIVYFKRESGAVAKTFAQHLRARGNVIVRLIWGSQWRGPENVLAVGAIVLEQGVPNEQAIADAYRQYSPQTEIHYMTSEGQWAEVAADDRPENTDPAGQPEPVQTETEAQTGTAEDGVPVTGEADVDADSVSDDGISVEPADDAAAGDTEGSREAS